MDGCHGGRGEVLSQEGHVRPGGETFRSQGEREPLYSTYKYGNNCALGKRKTRIVVRGFAQRYGRHFHETFAPVARLDSIRATIAYAVRNGMYIRQYNVATTYLNGELEEKVFLDIPD